MSSHDTSRPVSTGTAPTMTVREHMALAVESLQWRYPGAKEAYLREVLGWSPTRHAQVIAALIDRPDVAAAYPVLTARLRRLRQTRRLRRTSSCQSRTWS